MEKPPLWLRLLQIYGTRFPIARGKGLVTKLAYKSLPRVSYPINGVINKTINIELYPWLWADFCTFAIGCPELYILSYFQSILQANSTVFDIGAYMGIYAFTAGQIVHAGHVHVFEPHPESAQRIRCAIAQNNLNNIHLRECAVSEQSGELQFGLHPIPTQSSIMSNTSIVESLNVSVLSIDKYCRDQKILKIDVMKIDVEGAELLVLRGARRSIVQSRPQLLIELHKKQSTDFCYTVEDTIAYLRDLGYSLFFLAHGLTTRPKLIPWENMRPGWRRRIMIARPF